MSKTKSKKLIKATVGTLSILCILGLTIGLVFYAVVNEPEMPFGPPSASKLGKYETAAVSSDAVPCSAIGKDVLVEGGNAVDAAIAAMFCTGTVHPHTSGIGGGFFMTIYDPATKTGWSLDSREVAPLAATANMFNGNSSLSQKGGLAVAVPGEIAGFWKAHQRFGKLPWSRLILPSVIIAETGITVSRHLANALSDKSDEIKAEPSMWYFLNEETGQVLEEDDVFRRPAFAQTLRDIASYGIESFYNGTIGDRLVEDIHKRNGIITKEDLMQYSADWMEPVRVQLKDNLVMYSMPPPGSGVLAAYILNILDLFAQENENQVSDTEPLTYHRMAEAFKHAYAQRTKLADPRFVPEVSELASNLTSEEWAIDTRAKINDSFTSNDPAYYGAVTYTPDDKGTSHTSVLDADGMAVSATTTVNLYFGAGFTSEQTGIIPNDEMDDFSSPNVTNAFGVPPSEANFIQPGKRPLSSMTPTIIVDSATGKVRSVVGASGGTKITTAVVYTIIQNLWFGKTIKEAIDRPRIHHQLFPMTFEYETGFPKDITDNMLTKNHVLSEFQVGSSVHGLTVESDGYIYANADHRKGSDVAGIDPVE